MNYAAGNIGNVQPLSWTTEKPTQEGVYWIRVRAEYESKYVVEIANVSVMNGVVNLWYPVDGWECEDQYNAENVTHWLGPLPIPEPPNE